MTALPLALDDMNNGNWVQVAYFTDTDPDAVSSDYTASLGLAYSQCEVLPDPKGGFNVYAALTSPDTDPTSSSVTVARSDDSSINASVTDPILLDSGGMVVLDGLPAGAALMVSNWTTLDMNDQTFNLGSVTVAAGTITHGTMDATAFNLQNAWIDATLGDNGTSATVTVSGGGWVGLGGTNSYTGGTTIADGMLAFETSVPSTTGGISIQSSGALEADGAYGSAAAWLGSGLINTSSSGTLALTGDETSITLGSYSALSIGAANDVTFDGTITPAASTYLLGGGPGTLTVATSLTGANSLVSNGNVVLSGTGNTYSLGTQIASGMLDFADSVPSTSHGISIESGGALDVEPNGAYGNAHDWLGSGLINTGSTGALALTQDESTTMDFTNYPSLSLGAANDVVLSAGDSITPGSAGYQLGGGPGTLAVDCVLADYHANPTSLTVNGNVVLSGTNSYSGGTQINAGTLGIADNAAFGATSGAITFGPSGTLQALAGFTSARTIATPGTGCGTIDTNGFDVTLSGQLTDSGQWNVTDSSGTGAGIVTLIGNNSGFTGQTNLLAGTLDLEGPLGGTLSVGAGGPGHGDRFPAPGAHRRTEHGRGGRHLRIHRLGQRHGRRQPARSAAELAGLSRFNPCGLRQRHDVRLHPPGPECRHVQRDADGQRRRRHKPDRKHVVSRLPAARGDVRASQRGQPRPAAFRHGRERNAGVRHHGLRAMVGDLARYRPDRHFLVPIPGPLLARRHVGTADHPSRRDDGRTCGRAADGQR